VFAGDFSGNKQTQLLLVSPSGAWKLMNYERQPSGTTGWKMVAEAQVPPVNEWNQDDFFTTITSGMFLRWQKRDVLLTVARSKSDQRYSYTIHRFNPGKLIWESTYPHSIYGEISGIDTLKPLDRFFVAGTRNSPKIFRYNRDWRFDLKEISFNDSSFSIHSCVDFQRFDLDHNPKYYESLRLVPGCFQDPAQFSWMVIGKNAPGQGNEKILPDFIHLYATSK
jgi:hypothetical protein